MFYLLTYLLSKMANSHYRYSTITFCLLFSAVTNIISVVKYNVNYV